MSADLEDNRRVLMSPAMREALDWVLAYGVDTGSSLHLSALAARYDRAECEADLRAAEEADREAFSRWVDAATGVTP